MNETIEAKQMDGKLLAFIFDRYALGEPLPSLGKRVPELLAHILWLEEENARLDVGFRPQQAGRS